MPEVSSTGTECSVCLRLAEKYERLQRERDQALQALKSASANAFAALYQTAWRRAEELREACEKVFLEILLHREWHLQSEPDRISDRIAEHSTDPERGSGNGPASSSFAGRPLERYRSVACAGRR
jgi:hypothetical protein